MQPPVPPPVIASLHRMRIIPTKTILETLQRSNLCNDKKSLRKAWATSRSASSKSSGDLNFDELSLPIYHQERTYPHHRDKRNFPLKCSARKFLC